MSLEALAENLLQPAPTISFTIPLDMFGEKQLRRMIAVQLVAQLVRPQVLTVEEFKEYARSVDKFLEAGWYSS